MAFLLPQQLGQSFGLPWWPVASGEPSLLSTFLPFAWFLPCWICRKVLAAMSKDPKVAKVGSLLGSVIVFLLVFFGSPKPCDTLVFSRPRQFVSLLRSESCTLGTLLFVAFFSGKVDAVLVQGPGVVQSVPQPFRFRSVTLWCLPKSTLVLWTW